MSKMYTKKSIGYYGSRLAWRVKQLLPRTYYTTVGRHATEENPEGEKHFVIWKMLLGRSYQVEEFPVA